jgi:hypothetical protein
MIKIIKLFIALAFVSNAATAQYTATPNPSSSTGLNTDSDIISYASINIPAGTMLKWKRINNSLPAGWDALICDDELCWSPTYNGGNIYASVDGRLDVHFKPNGIVGTGTVTIRVWNPTDSATTAFNIVYNGTSTLVGIKDNNPNVKLKLFPNPATSIIYVEIDPIHDAARLDIYDIVGNKVKSSEVNTTFGFNTLDVTELRGGMYFLRVVDNRGDVLKATSFTKK